MAIGDFDEDGDADLSVEPGGAVRGDRYHSVLFQNTGQDHAHWLKVRLVGSRPNSAAIGAWVTAKVDGDAPRTIRREVTSGSSFGGHPLRRTLGLGPADRVATLEVFWPTSGTTQVFPDIAANQALEIPEFAADYRRESLEAAAGD